MYQRYCESSIIKTNFGKRQSLNILVLRGGVDYTFIENS